MAEKSMIIIGAGIAGLSAGCYARMNGYRTDIFEAQEKPGGQCTAWQRREYTFDFCLHHLAGAGPRSYFYPLWRELGAVQDREMIFPGELTRVAGPGGEELAVYTDLDRLESHLKELAPADTALIDEYIRAARRFTRFELMASLPGGPAGAGRLLLHLGVLSRWMKLTLEQFAARFTDPFLRRAFPCLQYGMPGVPAGIHLAFLAGCHNRVLGLPQGGSLEFARAVGRRYLELGGEVHYKSPVERILVENDRAVGVRLASGAEHRAGLIVSAADGYTTIFRLLEGLYTGPRIRAYYDSAPAGPQPFAVQVYLGVKRNLAAEPPALCLLLERPAVLAGAEQNHLYLTLSGGDSGAAPPGEGVIRAALNSHYAYWETLSEPDYRAEKERTAEAVLRLLEPRFPGLREQVVVMDVVTPLTAERFTGSRRGLQAWTPPGNPLAAAAKGLSRTLPGLNNFYMAGQWAEAVIGVSTAALSGRNLVRRLCRHERRPFVTTTPPGPGEAKRATPGRGQEQQDQ